MTRSILAGFLCTAVMSVSLAAVRPSPKFVVHLTPGSITPADYKGKVVILAMIMTTCQHCQHSTQILNGLQKEYGPRGLQIMAAAFETGVSPMVVTQFVRQFQPNFPVGYTSRPEVLAYLGLEPQAELYVPTMVFIDRKGMIRYQYLGDDPFFQNQEKNLRDTIERLLKEPSAAKKASPPAKKKDS